MPLTRTQVRAAFKAARAHFKGKIPKGTKLARFVPGHHKTSNSPRSSNHSPSRTRRSVSMAKKSSPSRHMSDVTKAKNAGLLALAFEPRIEDTIALGRGQLNSRDYTERILEDYTGLDMQGNFQPQRLARGYGPIVGALVLGKAISIVRKRFKV